MKTAVEAYMILINKYFFTVSAAYKGAALEFEQLGKMIAWKFLLSYIGNFKLRSLMQLLYEGQSPE